MQIRIPIQWMAAACLAVHCCALRGEPMPMRGLESPVMLPDGREFKTWEQPLRFDRTYYVDQSRTNASDANPCTSERPFATINRAAQVLQPGERVVVAAGIYRARVSPAHGEFSNSGVRLFTPPTSGPESDWVLVLDDADHR
jgi:hypothetical protein